MVVTAGDSDSANDLCSSNSESSAAKKQNEYAGDSLSGARIICLSFFLFDVEVCVHTCYIIKVRKYM
jgi:hypothetical protein